ncbi:MAG TPA: nucleotide exchange factor GrpE [Solimonas sp.]
MNDTPENPTTADDAPIDELTLLKVQLADVEARAEAAKDAQLRAIAELENSRRRFERDAANTLKYASEKILGELLAVADSLDLGLKAATGAEGPAQALAEGMELTRRQLASVLEKHGVKPIEPTGQPFNPEFHEAMSMVESTDVAPNHVLAVMQKGYLLHERLLRPAMVVVARAPAA